MGKRPRHPINAKSREWTLSWVSTPDTQVRRWVKKEAFNFFILSTFLAIYSKSNGNSLALKCFFDFIHDFVSVLADHPQETRFSDLLTLPSALQELCMLSLNHARNASGPFSLSSCQSQQILQISLLLSFEFIPYCLTMRNELMRYELWSHWCATRRADDFRFLLLLVTWGHSLPQLLPSR